MIMAIPFHWPSDEETEDNYRRLGSLLDQLCQLLHILLRPPTSQRREPESREESGPAALPDLVVSTLPAGKVLPPRRRRRHPKPAPPPRLKPSLLPSWLNFGLELSRQRTASVHQVERRGSSSTVTEEKLELRASSLVSLLVPTHLSGHLWTTVLLLVGWKLLTRQRS